ncbi:hypothetical protein RF11_14292 [Thelohanellus kitauei]|uniref:Uncharacterized protein n=1 Tax=Thelohanellus kitauei TaxID=669202 RepID=A0A0C2MK38_THEKT|nr:hypothetical protein RF11_14292 [Thelohanellus kitauei]
MYFTRKKASTAPLVSVYHELCFGKGFSKIGRIETSFQDVLIIDIQFLGLSHKRQEKKHITTRNGLNQALKDLESLKIPELTQNSDIVYDFVESYLETGRILKLDEKIPTFLDILVGLFSGNVQDSPNPYQSYAQSHTLPKPLAARGNCMDYICISETANPNRIEHNYAFNIG